MTRVPVAVFTVFVVLGVASDAPAGEVAPSASGSSPDEPLVVAEPADLLPVNTPEMEPGRLRATPSADAEGMLERLPQPLCLVGADARSLRWLERHRSSLRSAGALCLLVQAERVTDLDRVLDAAGEVPVQVSPGGELARRFGLQRYPVVISAEGFEQ
ncbi:PFL_4695 family integrating conjugative element protein [Aquisalimonas asiatica]|uniref:PFL_4695 family integrating conjugative element protein n=1 Tax=Aquisalimonas asiatica TaxID=406100 RepID=UPI001FDEC7D9|nr:integrating conjugative element protein [Aquisalimonas asiatica]